MAQFEQAVIDNKLKIDDSYVESFGRRCKSRGTDLEEAFTSYVDILVKIRKDSIMSGEFANALDNYIAGLNKLKGQITTISNSSKTDASSFLVDINNADSYLF